MIPSPILSTTCGAAAIRQACVTLTARRCCAGPASSFPCWRRATAALILSYLIIAHGAARAEPARYEIDAEHVTVAFLVEHLGYAKVLGRFREIEGSYRFDEETGTVSDVSVSVDTDSVLTDHRRRDRHLRSDDFLDTDRYPAMTFIADSARRTGEKTFEVAGSLELLGVTRPLVLNATWNRSSEHPLESGEYAMGVSARGSLKRSDYGMTYSVENGWVGDTVEILIEFEARRR